MSSLNNEFQELYNAMCKQNEQVKKNQIQRYKGYKGYKEGYYKPICIPYYINQFVFDFLEIIGKEQLYTNQLYKLISKKIYNEAPYSDKLDKFLLECSKIKQIRNHDSKYDLIEIPNTTDRCKYLSFVLRLKYLMIIDNKLYFALFINDCHKITKVTPFNNFLKVILNRDITKYIEKYL